MRDLIGNLAKDSKRDLVRDPEKGSARDSAKGSARDSAGDPARDLEKDSTNNPIKDLPDNKDKNIIQSLSSRRKAKSQTRPLGIYIHFPLCKTICPYCDFNVRQAHKRYDDISWHKAYLNQIRYFSELLGPRSVVSVFFGGGTPSLMSPQLIEDILQDISCSFQLSNKTEITCEINPDDATKDYLQALKMIGVNRFSLGVQSFCDKELQFLGRTHSAKQARDGFLLCQSLLQKSSLDLIYALPSQTLKAWHTNLTKACELCPSHLSAYELTFHPKTKFFILAKKGKLLVPSQDQRAKLYDMTSSLCERYNLPLYEVSNHAQKPFHCAHNTHIWRGGDYLGLGPAAAGRFVKGNTRYETFGIRSPLIWAQAYRAKQDESYKSYKPYKSHKSYKSYKSHKPYKSHKSYKSDKFDESYKFYKPDRLYKPHQNHQTNQLGKLDKSCRSYGLLFCRAQPLKTAQEEKILFGLRLRKGLAYAPYLACLDWDKIGDLRVKGFLKQTKTYLSATHKGRKVLDYIAKEIML